MTRPWHATPVDEVAAELGSDPGRGLSVAEAASRLEREGRNEIRKAERDSPLTIFARQFKNVVIWVLIGAAVVSVALGERLDGIAILTIVILNAVIGFLQEYRAEQAVAALAQMTAPRARVLREGQSQIVPAAEVVRGDLLVLAEGDLVAADARLCDVGDDARQRSAADRRVRGGGEDHRRVPGAKPRWPTAATWCSWAPAW